MRPQDTLVLMACSATKRACAHGLPLLELYDGPMWQTLRQHKGAIPDANVFVLSGRYAFGTALAHGVNYEQKISAEKVDSLIEHGIDGKPALPTMASNSKDRSLAFFRDRLTHRAVLRRTVWRDGRYAELPPWGAVINAGAGEYRRFFDWLIDAGKAGGIIAPDAPVLTVCGGIGTQRGQLGAHLRAVNGYEQEIAA